MNNNTKIRLRLSKNLFESLTREILAEAKVNDGYSVAVKQPKTPKQSKSQAISPEVQKTNKEKTEGLDPANIGPGGVVVDDDNWHQNGKKEAPGAPPIPPVPGKSAVDKLNLAGANMEIKDAKTFAKAILDIAQKLQSKEGFKPESNPNIKRAMDALRTLSSGAPAMPQVPTNKSANSAPKAPAMPGLKEKKMKEMETKVAENTLKEYENDDYRIVNGQCRRYNDEHEYTVVDMSNCR